MDALDAIRQAIITGNREAAREAVRGARQEGVEARRIVVEGIAAAMETVGQKFRANEFFVPELLIAQRAMKEALAEIPDESIDSIGTVVIGTVKGDLHDIGKNLVSAMLEGAGFRVVDLGVDVSPEAFVASARESSADCIAMSALLTTTMGSMRDTVRSLESDGLRDRVKVVIGGAPVTQAYADEIAADGYAPDAASAVEKTKTLLVSGGPS